MIRLRIRLAWIKLRMRLALMPRRTISGKSVALVSAMIVLVGLTPITFSSMIMASKKKTVKIKEYVIKIPRNAKKELLVDIKKILEKYNGDIPVILSIPQNGDFERIQTKATIEPSKELDEEIEKLLRAT